MKRDSGSTPDRATTPQSGVVHESHGADRQSPNTFVGSPSMTIKEMSDADWLIEVVSTYFFGEQRDRIKRIAKGLSSSPEAVTVMREALENARDEVCAAYCVEDSHCETCEVATDALLKVALQL